MTNETWSRIENTIRMCTFLLLIVPLVVLWNHSCDKDAAKDETKDDAYILTNPERVTALWGYQQLKMTSCKWCGRTVNLNRHHIIPQSANPALRDVKDNLIVLCRDCHFVLGHRCDWKQYNPDVLYICTHFTNCIRSATTRYAITNAPAKTISPDYRIVRPIDATPILHVTNDVPEKQRTALERILKWKPTTEGTNSVPFHPSQVR